MQAGRRAHASCRHPHAAARQRRAPTTRTLKPTPASRCARPAARRRRQRDERLDQLHLADLGDAADREPAVPGEEAQVHREHADKSRPPHAGQETCQSIGGRATTSSATGSRRAHHDRPGDHLPARHPRRQVPADRIAEGARDSCAGEQQIGPVQLIVPALETTA